MPSSAPRSVLVILTALAAITNAPAHAQIQGPISGEITVSLAQELDSKINPAGMSQAVITQSSIAEVVKGAAAVVQIVKDPVSGSFSARLVHVSVKTQAVPVYSAAAALAPTGANKADMFFHHGQAASGGRVYLTAGMNVKFTLSTPPIPPVPPAPANIWQPASVPSGYADIPAANGVSILGIATNGSRKGRVRLTSGCYKNSAVSTWLIVAQPLVGAGIDAFSDVLENQSKTVLLTIGDMPTQTIALRSVDLFQNTTLKFSLDVPEQFYTSVYVGKTLKISIPVPKGDGAKIDAEFAFPKDPTPMLAVAQPCIADTQKATEALARQEAETKAKIVMSCPNKAGKTLKDVKVRLSPSGQTLKPTDGDDSGVEWTLKSLKPGQHLTLECTYQPDSKSAKGASIGNRVTLPVPANAASCEQSQDLEGKNIAGSCSRR